MQYLLNLLPSLLEGTALTLQLFFLTLVMSIPLGIILAIARMSKFPPLNIFMQFYVWLFRGTPLLLQVLFVYFGLGVAGIKFDRMTAAVIAFVLNYAAYLAEIFRAGIQSIDRGQFEAADVLGLSRFQTMKTIILPQMFKLVLPPVSNEVINLIKDTALCAALSVPEILRNAKVTVARDFNVEAYIIAALIYLAFTFIIIRVFRALEKRYSYYSN
jgi:polar amino acid transport system permease protein